MSRFAAFISYAHADERWARWLHRRLEAYRPPRGVAAQGRPFRPIFRDRDELSAGHSLPDAIQDALSASDAMIVIASPRAARSVWVGREIEAFRALHGPDRIFALLVDGEPGDEAGEPFPQALTAPLPGQTERLEPMAADPRPGKDGRRRALLKIASGLLGVGYDRLAEREAARRGRRLAAIAGASTAMTVAFAGLFVYADAQRREAAAQRDVAERNLRTAERVSDFLVDTFSVANPATENADTITARTILERGIETVEAGLADEPEVQARVYDTLGEVATELALFDDAGRMLDAAHALMTPGTPAAFENRVYRAHLMERLGQLGEAAAVLTPLIAEVEAEMPDDHKLIGSAYHTLGNVQAAAYDSEAAIESYRRAARAYGAGDGSLVRRRGVVLSNAALANTRAGNQQAAEAQFREAIALLREEETGGRRALAGAHLGYAALHIEQKRYAEAEAEIAQALAIYESLLPTDHPEFITVRSLKVQVLEGQGRLEEAEREAARLVNVQRAVYPNGQLQIGYALVNYASILIRLGKGMEALAALGEAGQEYERAGSGDDAMLFGDLDAYRGLAHARIGELEQAQRLCREGLDVLGETLGADHPYTVDMQDRCRVGIEDDERTASRDPAPSPEAK